MESGIAAPSGRRRNTSHNRMAAMVRLIRAIHKQYLSSSSASLKTLILPLHHHHHLRQNSPIRSQTASVHSFAFHKSPFTSNIIRIIRGEIIYESEIAPPREPDTNFNSFTIQDLPGHELVTLRSKFGENEDIKVFVSMFDEYDLVPRSGSSNEGPNNKRLHISLIVLISKTDSGDEAMTFICSSWPDHLEIKKVYIRKLARSLGLAYMGPDFKKLDFKLQTALQEFLQARGVNDELAVFLHAYVWNKDRIELIKWLGDVQYFLEE